MNPTKLRRDAVAAAAERRIAFKPERVTALRARMGKTQEAMAAYLRIGLRTMVRWEVHGLPRGPEAFLLELLEKSKD